MLKIIEMHLLIIDLILINKENTINEVGNRKVVGAKVSAKITKSKNKSKNSINRFLAKFQLFAQSFILSFLATKLG